MSFLISDYFPDPVLPRLLLVSQMAAGALPLPYIVLSRARPHGRDTDAIVWCNHRSRMLDRS
jgi:hypothetical protein